MSVSDNVPTVCPKNHRVDIGVYRELTKSAPVWDGTTHIYKWTEQMQNKLRLFQDLQVAGALYYKLCSVNFRTGKKISASILDTSPSHTTSILFPMCTRWFIGRTVGTLLETLINTPLYS